MYERSVLTHAGKVSAEEIKAVASERYETFDRRRREAEALQADAEDLRTLEALEKCVKGKGA